MLVKSEIEINYGKKNTINYILSQKNTVEADYLLRKMVDKKDTTNTNGFNVRLEWHLDYPNNRMI